MKKSKNTGSSNKGQFAQTPTDEPNLFPWPVLKKGALYGIAGDIVSILSAKSEVDQVAILVTFLIEFGVQCGTNVNFTIGNDRHYPRTYAVIVGVSSKSRKGTSGRAVEKIFSFEDGARRSSGPLSSGEGLIYTVRDEIKEYRVDKITGVGEWIVTDPGVEDKRLFIIEEEFSNTLRVIRRSGNTLSTVLRCAWDGGKLEPLTKNSRISATNPHIGIVGHITIFELQQLIKTNEIFSGFANRFLWICSRRQGFVPNPRQIVDWEIQSIQRELKKLLKHAQKSSLVKLSKQAKTFWRDKYPNISKDRHGIVGNILNRAEVQVLRLSLIYALLDGCKIIDEAHLAAALTLWDYAEGSTNFIFVNHKMNPVAFKILDSIKDRGKMTFTELRDLFSRNTNREAIENAVQELVAVGIVEIMEEHSGRPGRPKKTIWLAKKMCA